MARYLTNSEKCPFHKGTAKCEFGIIPPEELCPRSTPVFEGARFAIAYESEFCKNQKPFRAQEEYFSDFKRSLLDMLPQERRMWHGCPFVMDGIIAGELFFGGVGPKQTPSNIQELRKEFGSLKNREQQKQFIINLKRKAEGSNNRTLVEFYNECILIYNATNKN